MTTTTTGYHLDVDEGEPYDFLSTLSIVKASAAATNNTLRVVEQRLPAGFSPPPHIHHDEDEAFYLLSGRVEAQIGEQQVSAQRGSFLWLPRNVQHGFIVSSDGPWHDAHHDHARRLRGLRCRGGNCDNVDRPAGSERARHPPTVRDRRALRHRVPASAGPVGRRSVGDAPRRTGNRRSKASPTGDALHAVDVPLRSSGGVRGLDGSEHDVDCFLIGQSLVRTQRFPRAPVQGVR